MVAIKDGETSTGDKFRSFVCSNNEGGCDFFETKYGDLTPPGILITEEMTAQDVEKLREQRRNRGMGIALPGSPSNPFDREHYHRIRFSQQTPAPFLPPLQPISEEPQEGSPDDLPF